MNKNLVIAGLAILSPNILIGLVFLLMFLSGINWFSVLKTVGIGVYLIVTLIGLIFLIKGLISDEETKK